MITYGNELVRVEFVGVWFGKAEVAVIILTGRVGGGGQVEHTPASNGGLNVQERNR